MAEYVNNREFFAKYCEWKTEYRQAIIDEVETPRVTNYLGDCILKICNNLSCRYNFVGYSYRSELAEDAIEACFRAIAKFDETQYQNIFGYFTMIAFHACQKRIKIEKHQQKIKIELIKDCIYEGISRQEFDDEDYQMQMKDIIISTMDSNSMDDRIREMAIHEINLDLAVAPVVEDDEEYHMDIF